MTIEKAIDNARVKKGKGIEIPYEPFKDLGLDAAFKKKVLQLQEVQTILKQAEEEKKQLQEEIKRSLSERNRDRARVDDTLRVLCYEGQTIWLDKEKLLENGVSMDVIEASKNSKSYTVVKLIKD